MIVRRVSTRAAALCLALACGPALAHAPAAGEGFGSRNPKAPPETEQFAFLIGEWECAMRTMRPDGTLVDGPAATWTGYWILDGWAIQDDWVSPLPDGSTGHGTNIRSFDARDGKWDNRWLASGSLQWKHYEAERVGETMVMTGGEGVDAAGRPYVDRNTFHDIREDSWKWRKDRSFDGGETWVEGVATIEARRRR